MKSIWGIAVVAVAFLMAAALGRWPYSFYVVMRVVVCVAGVYLAMESVRCSRTLLAITFSCCALLFNPIFPLHMRRSDWRPLNIAASIAIVVCAAALTWRSGTRAVTLRH
jgi:hypothetical protein